MSFRWGKARSAKIGFLPSSPPALGVFLFLSFSYPIDRSRPTKHDARASTAEGKSGARRMVTVVYSERGLIELTGLIF